MKYDNRRVVTDGEYYTLWDVLEILNTVNDDIKTARNILGCNDESGIEKRIQDVRNIIGKFARSEIKEA